MAISKRKNIFSFFFDSFRKILCKSSKNHACKQYADDTKLMAAIQSMTEVAQLQSDINTQVYWCKILHICESNPQHPYSMPHMYLWQKWM
jgi:hypothetical protein